MSIIKQLDRIEGMLSRIVDILGLEEPKSYRRYVSSAPWADELEDAAKRLFEIGCTNIGMGHLPKELQAQIEDWLDENTDSDAAILPFVYITPYGEFIYNPEWVSGI